MFAFGARHTATSHHFSKFGVEDARQTVPMTTLEICWILTFPVTAVPFCRCCDWSRPDGTLGEQRKRPALARSVCRRTRVNPLPVGALELARRRQHDRDLRAFSRSGSSHGT